METIQVYRFHSCTIEKEPLRPAMRYRMRRQ